MNNTMKGVALGLSLLIAGASMPAHADAIEGTVVYNKSGCRSRYVVETTLGYAILEWYGGYDPSEGDVLAGEINSYGFKDLYNITKKQSAQVWIEDYLLSKSRLQEKFFKKFCNK